MFFLTNILITSIKKISDQRSLYNQVILGNIMWSSLIFESGSDTLDFKEFKPVTITANRTDSGNYSIVLKTSNEKLKEILLNKDNFSANPKITVVTYGMTPDTFIGVIGERTSEDMGLELTKIIFNITRFIHNS